MYFHLYVNKSFSYNEKIKSSKNKCLLSFEFILIICWAQGGVAQVTREKVLRIIRSGTEENVGFWDKFYTSRDKWQFAAMIHIFREGREKRILKLFGKPSYQNWVRAKEVQVPRNEGLDSHKCRGRNKQCRSGLSWGSQRQPCPERGPQWFHGPSASLACL